MIESVLQLGEPVAHRGIVLCPLFPRRDPHAAYVTLEEALPLGFRIGEVSEAGSVPELAVVNPTDAAVLLYDGEELLGAMQNRILNVTVLVGAGATLPIPVSCVEEGRWHSRSAEFAAAPHASHPHMRRRKAETLAAQPLARGIAQGEMWDEVRAKSARMGVHSETGANADVFRSFADELRDLEVAFPATPGQCGALLALGDDLCLDYVSRPEAFACLYPKLLRGYLLDALERLDGPATGQQRVHGLVSEVVSTQTTSRPSAGLGEDVRLESPRVIGSGLVLDGEVHQLSAFTSGREGRTLGRIARPSARR